MSAPLPIPATPSIRPSGAARQRGSTFAQVAILIASIGVVVLAVLQVVRP
jgi:hypothetical protein